MHVWKLCAWLSCALLLFATSGCASPAVGDPCLPEQVPASGFHDTEAYVESSSLQCETRVCIVYHLGGDPREGCVPSGDPHCIATASAECAPVVACPTTEEIEERVYCTCRCDSDGSGFAECECPSGFACAPVLAQGGAGVRGGYCVRKSTLVEGE